MISQVLQRLPRVRRAAGYIRRRFWDRDLRPTQGLPPGLEIETVDALCRQRGIGKLRQCTHVHLSGWKTLGTYRLEILTDSGAKWSLIFKNECYRPELIPAIEGLPVLPGPPEALIYKAGTTVLSSFLPKLIWFHELEPRQHFQYMLEDLAKSHVRLKMRQERTDYIPIVHALIEIHKQLNHAFDGRIPDGFIHYDRNYSENLLKYALNSLSKYKSRTGDGTVEALLNRWQDIESVHQRDEFYDNTQHHLIHGDFNGSNIYVDRANEAQVKVVDWEWAGVGVPHADLVTLLKSKSTDEQLTLLEVFINEDKRLDLEQHRRIFYWCFLERRLLDAAYLANHEMLSRRRVFWMPRAIRLSAKDVMTAVESLQSSIT